MSLNAEFITELVAFLDSEPRAASMIQHRLTKRNGHSYCGATWRRPSLPCAPIRPAAT